MSKSLVTHVSKILYSSQLKRHFRRAHNRWLCESQSISETEDAWRQVRLSPKNIRRIITIPACISKYFLNIICIIPLFLHHLRNCHYATSNHIIMAFDYNMKEANALVDLVSIALILMRWQSNTFVSITNTILYVK